MGMRKDRGVTMKKRGIYIGSSILIFLLLIFSCLFVTFSNAAIFFEKNGSLSIPAIFVLCTCIFLAVCDIALFIFTNQGKFTIKQSFRPQGTILVYFTAAVLITALVSYFSIFCVNTLANSARMTNRQSISDMISSS